MTNLLLFMTDFYGYNENIIDELSAQGFNVTWFLDKIKLTAKDRIYRKLQPDYLAKKFDVYFDECIKKAKEKKIDAILIIFGASYFRRKHIEHLRKEFPGIGITYYAWDSVSNFPLIEDLLKYSDYAYTFDMNDAEKYNVSLLPLFYVNKLQNGWTSKIHDFSTVMSFFVEKAINFDNILKELPENADNFFYLKLRDKLYYYKLILFHKNEISSIKQYFEFKPLPRQSVIEHFLKSHAVVDCPLPEQNGLTMRTFEVLALNVKLVTTNLNIKKYDFYSEDNIYVVGDGRTDIEDFIKSDFNVNYSLSEKYSISSFISTLTKEIKRNCHVI